MIKPQPQTPAQRQAKRRARDGPKKVDITPRTRTLLTELHRSTGLTIDTVIWQALVLLSEKLAAEAGLPAPQQVEAAPARDDVPPVPNPPVSPSPNGELLEKLGQSTERIRQSTAGEVATADARSAPSRGVVKPRDEEVRLQRTKASPPTGSGMGCLFEGLLPSRKPK